MVHPPSRRFNSGVMLALTLCLWSLSSRALDACRVLGWDVAFSIVSPAGAVVERSSTNDGPHRSTCGYRSSDGKFLLVVISDDSDAYDNDLRSPPKEKATGTPIPDLGDRALLWDSSDGVQAIATAGHKFVRVALLKQSPSESAAAQKTVTELVRQALAADWGGTTLVNSSSVRVLLPQSATPASQVPPTYPPLARQARIQGTVVLVATIGTDGSIEYLQTVSGHPLLVPAAMSAVKQWKYKPYLLNGNPIEVETEVHVNFSLGETADH